MNTKLPLPVFNCRAYRGDNKPHKNKISPKKAVKQIAFFNQYSIPYKELPLAQLLILWQLFPDLADSQLVSPGGVSLRYSP
jgi:hypothetical protein